MNPKNILVVSKTSKYEWDMRRLKLDGKDLLRFYKKGNLDANKIIQSHKRQKEGLSKLKSLMPQSIFITRDELTKHIVKNSELVVSFGGDNHFLYVSHFVEDVPILGINSDPELSEGALTSVTAEGFEKYFSDLLEEDFKIEKWTRLNIYVNGEELEFPAVSEVFIGESQRLLMSRHRLSYSGKSEEQKGSGILITTGVGSTGWYSSACRYLFPKGNSFQKNRNEARFILTEPYRGKLLKYKFLRGKISKNEELKIQSLSDSQGILSIDSLEDIKLKEGSIIIIKTGPPLKVALPSPNKS